MAGFSADAPFPPLAELTRAGALLVAAYHRLPLRRAKARLGLSGGGPERPFGRRGQLLRHLGHTQAVVALLGGFAEALRRAATAGIEAELLECSGTGACGRGPFQPDAYVRLRYAGRAHEFYLELEHGTAKGREGYPKKLARYHTHNATSRGGSGRPVLFLVDHWKDPAWAARGRSPTYRRKQNEVLLERIAREARAADARAGRRLDVRLTTLPRATWSASHDPTAVRLGLPPVDLKPLLAGRPLGPLPAGGGPARPGRVPGRRSDRAARHQSRSD